jgi:hypothetical protein
MKKLKQKIREQIDYGDYPERMDPKTERALGDPEKNLYGTNPAMRRGSLDVERLGSDRFKKIVDKLRDVMNAPNLNSANVIQSIQREFMSSVLRAKEIENYHEAELEELAIKSCLELTETPEGKYEIDAKLTGGPGEISSEGFQFKPKDNPPEEDEDFELPDEGQFEAENLTKGEQFELEKHKRNIINGIIQGMSKKGHYIFQKPEIREKLDEIDPSLYGYYLKIMAINDYFYFKLEDMIQSMSQHGHGIEGRENLKTKKKKAGSNDDDDEGRNDQGPEHQIIARGLIFPILCHEIIKGIEETLGKFGYGYGENSERTKEVLGQTETLPNEAMALRIGPGLVKRIRQQLPDEMFAEENFGIKPFFYVLLYQIPAPQFLELIRDVISEDERDNYRARSKFREIFERALKIKKRYERKRQGLQEPINPPVNVEKPINTLITEPKPESSSKDIDNATLAGMGLNALNFELNKAIDDQNWDLAMKIQRMIDRKQR